eukprot:TRINITY_DN28056_c1_g1_i1.p1 TRINITY_DN28056_c1_g1~~TRINITY_DN28056_c1_g1_i1.p1  ORF type:complete len:323 (+),score=51.00 TRINITY_DN28056_c1_g1_i1:307-1275(+)
MRRESSVDAVSVGAAIDAFARSQRCEEAVQLLQNDTYGVPPDQVAYSAVVKAFAQAGRPREAALWLGKMREAQLRPDTTSFNTVIHAWAKVGDVEEAKNWMTTAQASGMAPNVVTYSSLIDACSKAGKAADAISLLRHMESAKVEPSVVTFNSVINACARSGLLRDAENFLQEMVTKALRPDQTSYASVVQATIHAGRPPEEAARWLDKAQQEGVSADAVLYNSVINAFSRARQSCRCVELLNAMENGRVRPTKVTYTSIFQALGPSSNSDPAPAVKLVHHMKKSGVKPDHHLLAVISRILPSETLRQLGIHEVQHSRPNRR